MSPLLLNFKLQVPPGHCSVLIRATVNKSGVSLALTPMKRIYNFVGLLCTEEIFFSEGFLFLKLLNFLSICSRVFCKAIMKLLI